MTQPLASTATTTPASSTFPKSSNSKVHSLATLWARKYFVAVTTPDESEKLKKAESLKEATSQEGRERTAKKLLQKLNLASAQAWSKTETMLSDEIRRHGINPELIKPLEIADDTRYLFEKTLQAYSLRATPRHLSVLVGKDFGRVRQKYTSIDPRAIGFVSMQFHYTGQMLLEWLSTAEQGLWMPYLKVMDDHMYMPLAAAYDAAADHDYDSPALAAVRHLLPVSSKIAYKVCTQVSRLHPNYHTHSGALTDITVRTASIRDAEMFQVYLCLCILTGNMNSVQRELFPLCVMLYPRLNVRWRLVQDMLQNMGWELHGILSPDHMATVLPYLRTMTEMFSDDVFRGS